MELYERLTYLIIGGFVGFVLGWISARLDRIKEEVDEIDEIVKHERNEDGIARLRPLIQDAILLGVVVMVAWAAFATQRTTNHIQANQERIEQISVCNQKFLSKTIVALNNRTRFTVAQTRANVAVQQAQADFFLGLYENPLDDELELQLARDYAEALKKFVAESGELDESVDDFPYATPEELTACLDN